MVLTAPKIVDEKPHTISHGTDIYRIITRMAGLVGILSDKRDDFRAVLLDIKTHLANPKIIPETPFAREKKRNILRNTGQKDCIVWARVPKRMHAERKTART